MVAVIKSIRGTRDLLPPETALWNFAEAAVRDVFRVYNFREIRTPIIEDLQLFQRSVGEETDIVGKEMFAWEDRSRAQSEKSQWLALWTTCATIASGALSPIRCACPILKSPPTSPLSPNCR